MSYGFLLDLALILLSTKLLGMLTRRVRMPQVVGALLAGLILGPSMLNILQETDFISQISELGVIVILFAAGIGTDIQQLRSSGKAGFFVALCGVLVPLGLGAMLTELSCRVGLLAVENRLEALFVGTILTATSVSITVETLKELGKLNTKVGNTILAAALIDDVLGLVALTIVSSLAGEGTAVWLVLIKVALFFLCAFIAGALALRGFRWMVSQADGRNLRRYPVLAFVLCLVMAYCAEKFFGVADIIGAYAAGLVISCTPKAKYVESKFEPLSYLLLTPVFFASVGINADIKGVDSQLLVFSVLLLATAILSKIIGCGLGAKACGFNGREALQTGIGMACRGEVALIVANRGVAMGVLSQTVMTPIIITVVGCAVLTPVMLKIVFHKEPEEIRENPLADRYGETEQLDIVSEQLLQKSRDYWNAGRKSGENPFSSDR